MNALLPVVMAALVAGSQWWTNPEDMGKEFAAAQRLLASGDFDGARKSYEALLRVPEHALMRPSRVRVKVDDKEVNLREAARYQLANLDRREGLQLLREAGTASPAAAGSLRAAAPERLASAAASFGGLRDEPGFGLREMAAFLVVDCWFEAGMYEPAAAAARKLLELFPGGRYRARARYALGWSLFHLGEFSAAAAAFAGYLEADSTSARADRARLQRGLALERQGEYAAALQAFDRLARSRDPEGMSHREQAEAALSGLREGESRRLLAAKAWVKKGDMHRRLGELPAALAAYRKVAGEFAAQTAPAETAWLRLAEVERQANGVDAALAVYRYGAETAAREPFRGRLQAGLMTLLFEEGRYAESLAAHLLYLASYGAVAAAAGVGADEARYRAGECYRLLAVTAEEAETDSLLEAAAAAYRLVYEDEGSSLGRDARFRTGHIRELLGDLPGAVEAFAAVAADSADAAIACQAELRLAGLEPGQRTERLRRILARCEDGQVRAAAALELAHGHGRRGETAAARELLQRIPPGLPQWPQAQLMLAQARAREGDVDGALALLSARSQDAVDADFERQLRAQTALLLQRRGRHEEALAILREAAPGLRGGLRVPAHFGWGRALFLTGNPRAAWDRWAEVLRRERTTAAEKRALLRALGACARELGEPERMLPVFEAMLADSSSRVQGRLGLARHFLDSGMPGKAAAQARRVAPAAGSPEAARAALLLAGALAAQDSLTAAEAVLLAGLKQGPDREAAAEMQFQLGSLYQRLGRHAAARRSFSAAAGETDRRDLAAAAAWHAAHSHAAAGEEPEATALFRRVAGEFAEQPQAAQAALLLAEKAHGGGDLAAALRWYETIRAQWPASPEAADAAYGAAWCHLEVGNGEAMDSLFRSLPEEFPDHPRARKGLLNLGDFYYNRGDHPAAREVYEEVAGLYPGSGEAAQAREVLRHLDDAAADSLYRKGMEAFDAGAFEAAIRLLRQVVETWPGTPSEAAARCNIGMAYQRLGEHRAAARVYDEAVRALEGREEEREAREFARRNRAWIAAHIFGGEAL